MNFNTEDVIPISYKYSWAPGDEGLTIEDFLAKYRPSMVQNDGTKPWIWVRRSDPQDPKEYTAATIEAREYLQEVTDRVESIKNDDSIPLRSNKKTGAKSKKDVREQVQAEATIKLKGIATRHGDVCGKWLIFSSADKVDLIWRTIATSLISGPLSQTAALCTKVATSPANETPNNQHVICLYLPDVYDKDEVTKTMQVLLRKHGAVLSGVKSDLYTRIGLDSKHPSGIQSTIWKNASLMEDSKIKELRDAFFADLAAGNDPTPKAPQPAPSNLVDQQGSSSNNLQAPTGGVGPEKATKANPKPKKKAKDDPFASDHDDEEGAGGRKAPSPTIQRQKKLVSSPSQPQKPTTAQPGGSGSSDDDQQEPKGTNARSDKGKGRAVGVGPKSKSTRAGPAAKSPPKETAKRGVVSQGKGKVKDDDSETEPDSDEDFVLLEQPSATVTDTKQDRAAKAEVEAAEGTTITGAKRSVTKAEAKPTAIPSKRVRMAKASPSEEEADAQPTKAKRATVTRRAPAVATRKKSQAIAENDDVNALESVAVEDQLPAQASKRGTTRANKRASPVQQTTPDEVDEVVKGVEPKTRRSTKGATPKPDSSKADTKPPSRTRKAPSSTDQLVKDDAVTAQEGNAGRSRRAKRGEAVGAPAIDINVVDEEGAENVAASKPKHSTRTTAATKRGQSAVPEDEEGQVVKKSRTTRK